MLAMTGPVSRPEGALAVAVAGLAPAPQLRVSRTPSPVLVAALALAGIAAATASFALALANEQVPEPGLQAALMAWMTLPYVFGGLVAWWRRPDSRLGPLMLAAGFAIFISSLAWAEHALPFTIGQS